MLPPEAHPGSTPEGAAAPAVALADISPHPLNPRDSFDDEEVAELVASILELGILEPVVLLPIATVVQAWAGLDDDAVQALTGGRGRPWPQGAPAGARWVLLAGHRRDVDARTVGLVEVPAIVRDDLAAQIAAMVAENIGRRGLSLPLDPGPAGRRIRAHPVGARPAHSDPGRRRAPGRRRPGDDRRTHRTWPGWARPMAADPLNRRRLELVAPQRRPGDQELRRLRRREGHRVLSWQSTTDQPVVVAEEGWAPTLA